MAKFKAKNDLLIVKPGSTGLKMKLSRERGLRDACEGFEKSFQENLFICLPQDELHVKIPHLKYLKPLEQAYNSFMGFLAERINEYRNNPVAVEQKQESLNEKMEKLIGANANYLLFDQLNENYTGTFPDPTYLFDLEKLGKEKMFFDNYDKIRAFVDSRPPLKVYMDDADSCIDTCFPSYPTDLKEAGSVSDVIHKLVIFKNGPL